ncbi:MAG: YadA-like family protein [Paracoccus sp. (in: a-proteobacteria)]|uniref:YadA-like family protein n=1 Tax=Paracoccus sp. TaxID=267 RepID=UPI0026E01219|nr:YadA-like family protein [Paracoccus sp. (in: a-proteobacteria)]MDO5613524.1 YadA-like family protein [Paracoccus sp. (in: a-proteobacteria)]
MAATGNAAVAVGNSAKANADNTTAIGQGASASGTSSVALGHGALTERRNSIAVGVNAKAQGNDSFALGIGAVAAGHYSIVMGSGAGRDSTDKASNLIAIGANAGQGVSTSENVAIGSGAGRNIGALGVDRTDITCVWGHGWWCQSLAGGGDGSANNAIGTNAGTGTKGMQNNAIGWHAGRDVQGQQNVALGTGAGLSLIGSGNVAIGGDWAGRNVIGDYNYAGGTAAGSYVTGVGNIALGHKAGAGTSAEPLVVSRSIAIGQATLAGTDSIAMGSGARATGEQSIAIGTGNQVTGNHAGAIGDPNTVSGDGSYAVGNNNMIEAANSFVIGNDVAVAAGLDGAVALGNGATVAAAVPVTGGAVAGVTHSYAGVAAAAGDVVSVGAAGAERQVQNVAAGRVAAGSTDAVNGSQLYATNTELTATRINLPGGWSGAETYALGRSGAGGNAVTMTNLAAGQLSATSTDAVNGAQLYATNQELAALKAGTAAVISDIGDLRANMAGGWAADGKYALDHGGTAAAPVVMTNVAAGDVAANSTDAVNGAQLHTARQDIGILRNETAANTAAITANAERLPGHWAQDGSSGYVLGRTDGQAVALSNVAAGRVAAGSGDAVNGAQLHAVSSDVAGVKAQVSANTASIGETRAQLPGRWSQDRPGTYMLRQSDSDTAPVTISNLGRGRISAGSTDAVTGGQMYELSAQVSAQGHDIARNRREANSGISGAMALATIRHDDRPAKLSIGFGLGNYKGATSMSLGAGYVSRDEKWRFSGGMTYGGGNDMGAAFGATYTFD